MVTRLITTILLFSITTACTSSTQQTAVEVVIKGEMFLLELSTDMPSRINGLMQRTTIPDHGGMLFVFTDAQERSFWMANCMVNIDILFLGRTTREAQQARVFAQTQLFQQPLPVTTFRTEGVDLHAQRPNDDVVHTGLFQAPRDKAAGRHDPIEL